MRSFGAFFVLLFFFSPVLTMAEQPPLILALPLYRPRQELITRFSPLADYLAAELGRKVVVRVGRDYLDHYESIGTDSVDIAYIGPVLYVKLYEQYGPKPLLAQQVVNGQPFLKGKIVVRNDSPLRVLADLKGRSFAFSDPDSTTTRIATVMLENAGITLKDLSAHQFFAGYTNVALAVLTGDFDAGACSDDIYQEWAKKGLKVLAETLAVPDQMFVASATMPPPQVAQLRHLLTSLPETPAGLAIMSSIRTGMTSLVIPKDSDFDTLRQLIGAKMVKH